MNSAVFGRLDASLCTKDTLGLNYSGPLSTVDSCAMDVTNTIRGSLPLPPPLLLSNSDEHIFILLFVLAVLPEERDISVQVVNRYR